MQFGKGTQIQFRREYLATNPLEDEDDDEYENDVPGEWRPMGFRAWLVDLTSYAKVVRHERYCQRQTPDVGRDFQGVCPGPTTQG